MFSKLNSLGIFALDGFVVTVEVDISGGLPQFAIVGLPDSAVKEATDRVRSALKNLGFTYPVSRITVNLAPADVKKTGPVYDLPLLLGLLSAGGQIPQLPGDSAFLGELSLDGNIRPVAGILPMALACESAGIARLFLPCENAEEAAVAKGVTVYPVKNVNEIVAHFTGKAEIEPWPTTQLRMRAAGMDGIPDFSDVRGQLEARRAMEIAAVGFHNILLIGAPGTGKSMLAKRLPGILPPMTYEEAVETSKIYSVASNSIGNGKSLITYRPFRSPHHSVSLAGLAGGGTVPKPGEISLAHNGVLFLDELPEFQRDTLEVLRQPMEDKQVTLSRVWGNMTFPSQFMMVAAMNPCPCGYFGHPKRECRCGPNARERYLQKVSGPLLDRIDLHVEVQPVEFEELSSEVKGEGSSDIAGRVMAARSFQSRRQEGAGFVPNAVLQGDALRRACTPTTKAAALLKMAFERMGLSARGYDRVLRVARTIADLDASEKIEVPHIAEAVQYRNLDRKYWYSR